MSTMDSEGDTAPGSSGTHVPAKGRNAWIWVSAVLALAVVGLLIWQFNTQSELDDAHAQVKELQAQIDQGKASGSTAAASYKSAYADLEEELGSTQADLSATEKELTAAQDATQQAQDDAAAAKQQADQAQSATQKAQAEADQASADAKAAEATITITKDCANAFLSQVAVVVESEDPEAAASGAKQELRASPSSARPLSEETKDVSATTTSPGG